MPALAPVPWCLQPGACFPTGNALAETGWTCLLSPAVYHKRCLLDYLYAKAPPHATPDNKPPELPGFCSFSRAQSTRHQLSCVCVSGFHSLSGPVQSWSCVGWGSVHWILLRSTDLNKQSWCVFCHSCYVHGHIHRAKMKTRTVWVTRIGDQL